MRARTPLAIVVATTVALFTAASTTHTGTGGAQTCAPQKVGNTPISVNSGGITRTALVHVPPRAARSRPLPLVLAFHGAGGTGAWMEDYTGLSGVGDKGGFFVAYPDAYAKARARVWNISGPAGRSPDDVAFGRDLLNAIQQRFCVDPGRVFATGISNGGGMAARLGCELSDRLLAIAPVAGGYSKLPPCRPVRPVSMLEIHDTDDPVVPYKGRGPAGAGSVPRYVRAWAQRNRCPLRSGFSRPNRRVLRRYWTPCASGVTVEQLIVLGGGHEWPGAPAGGRGRPRSISASGQIWRFFAAARR
jgi:polyhydroxybutyrate depolymerase